MISEHFTIFWGEDVRGRGRSVANTFVCFLLFLVLLVVMLFVVASAALFCFYMGLWREFCAAFAWSSLFSFPSSVHFFCLEETCHCRWPHTCLWCETVILMTFSMSLFCWVFSHGQGTGVILFCASEFSIPLSSLKMLFLIFDTTVSSKNAISNFRYHCLL
jgi:hypothetical protein